MEQTLRYDNFRFASEKEARHNSEIYKVESLGEETRVVDPDNKATQVKTSDLEEWLQSDMEERHARFAKNAML